MYVLTTCWQIEDKYDIVNKELLLSKSQMLETEEEKKRLGVEVHQVWKTFLMVNELELMFRWLSLQLKELCRREAEKAAGNDTRNQAIILDYKQVLCSLNMNHSQT